MHRYCGAAVNLVAVLAAGLVGFIGLVGGRALAADAGGDNPGHSRPVLQSPWPQYQGPDGSGISPETNLARAWPASGPRTLWSVEVGEGYAGAAVRDGEVYLLDGVYKEKDVLRCFDLETGRERWQEGWANTRDAGFPGTKTIPVVDQERVYALSADGQLLCFDRQTRKLAWKHHISAEFNDRKMGPRWGFTTNPLPYKDLIIVGPQSRSVGLVAYDCRTGQTRWKSPYAGLNVFSNQQPALMKLCGVEQIVFLGNKHDSSKPPALVSGFEAAGGKLLWQTLTPRLCNVPIPAAVQISDDTLFLSQGYTLGGLALRVVPRDKADANLDPSVRGFQINEYAQRMGDNPVTDTPYAAELMYEAEKCDTHLHKPLFYKGSIYANSYDGFHVKPRENAGLVCIDPRDGKLRWKSGPEQLFENGSLLIADGLIYILHGATGELFLVEASPGQFRALAHAKVLEARGRKAWAPMALSCGKLLVRDQATLKCLDVRNP